MSFDFDLVRKIVKKRGRKSERDLEIIRKYKVYIEENNIEDTIITQKKPVKKRGRKPKGGKITVTQTNMIMNGPTFTKIKEYRPNIIVHLKCSDTVKDKLVNTSEIPYMQLNNNTLLSSEFTQQNDLNKQIIITQTCNQTHNDSCQVHQQDKVDYNSIQRKLKDLQKKINTNQQIDKKSACFWCSYDFDNLPIFIPRSVRDETYEVYGCFCTPECAVAYLFDENIDSYLQWERYSLLNHIYSCIYEYSSNIKPAPSPYYILDKFYGNLSINDYRNLHRTGNTLLVVDKPLLRVMPDIYVDNEDIDINNIYTENTQSNQYKLYRKKPHYTDKTNIGNIKSIYKVIQN